jgi:nucleotidyltransferase/DNA polymerase involved in DNA repair
MNDSLNSIDYNSLVIDNEYLIKSYLLLKININKGCIVEPMLENKLLLKIIDIFLDKDFDELCNEDKQEFTEITMKIYAFIANDYCKFFNSNNQFSLDLIGDYDELKKNMPDLIYKLKTITKIELDSDTKLANRSIDILGLLKLSKINYLVKDFLDEARHNFSLYLSNFLNKNVNNNNNKEEEQTSIETSGSYFKSNINNKTKIEELVIKILEKILKHVRRDLKAYSFRKYKLDYNQFRRLLDDLEELIEINANLNSNNSSSQISSTSSDSSQQSSSEFKSTSESILNSTSLDSDDYDHAYSKSNTSLRLPSKRKLSLIEYHKSSSSTIIKRPKYKTDLEAVSLSTSNSGVASTPSTTSEDDAEDHITYERSAYYTNPIELCHDYNRLFETKSKINDKNISIPFESYIQFSPLQLPVNKVPGIGVAYAARLKSKGFGKLGDLVDLYQIKCENQFGKFHCELKNLASMRADSIYKIHDIIENYLKNIKS